MRLQSNATRRSFLTGQLDLERTARARRGRKRRRNERRLEHKTHECHLEVLETREVLAASIADVDLVVDTGSSTADLVTSDPRLSVSATGPLSDPSGHARLEFDHNGDGTADGFLDVGSLDAVVVYDPRTSDPSLSFGALAIKYRALEYDGSNQLIGTQSWGTFNFFYAASSAGEIAVLDGLTDLMDGAATIDFGQAQRGTPVNRVLTVKNLGASPVFVHRQLHLPRGFELFDAINSSTLAPGASDTFTVRLTAQSAGEFGGEAMFFNGDSSESPFNLMLEGQVVAPEIQVSLGTAEIANAGSLEFGSVALSASLTRTFEVKNVGDGILNLGSVTVPTGYTLVAAPNDTSLDPDQSTTFQVRLDAASAGEFNGQISFSTNDTDETPFAFTVLGSVDRAEIEVLLGMASLVSNSSAVSFGATPLWQQVQQALVVKNVGTQSLTVSGASAPSGFSLSAIPGGGVLAPGASFNLTVTYLAGATGTQQGSLTLTSTDPNEGTFSLHVTGTTYQFQTLGLLNDTGSSQTDEVTTDPRVLATLAGGDPASVVLVEVDTDLDGSADELLEPDEHDRFIYDPDAGIGTSLSWNLRLVVHNEVLDEDRYGTWAGVDFTRTTDTDGDPSITNLALVHDTGLSDIDDYTADPTLEGNVLNDGSTAYLVVYMDLDNDGDADDETVTDSTGRFEYRPLDLELGAHTIQFAPAETRWGGAEITGAWSSYSFTLINPIAPQIDNLDLVLDTGFNGDNSTLDPTLTGEVVSVEDSTSFEIQFDVNGDDIIDGTAASLLDGTFFFTPDLDTGSYTVRARAKDIVLDVIGNWASISLTVQQLAPPVLTELELFDDTGSSSTDLVTSNPTVAGSVTHDLGSGYRTVEFDWNGDLVADGEILTGADGTFAFTPMGLSLGSVTVRARTTIYDERSGDTLRSNWTNLTFTLEARTGATIDTLELANDTGTSSTDNITTDPTLSGTIVSDGPVAYVLIEFDVNDDGLVDGSTRTNEVGAFTYRPEGLAYGSVIVQARAADWDPPSGDFLIGDWESVTFTLEEGSSVDAPPPPGSEEAIDQASGVANVIGGGYRAGINDGVDAYNDAVGSSIVTAGAVDLHIGSYASSSGTHQGGVPGFGSFGYESGAFSAGGAGSPISFGGPVIPTASSYSDTITVSESGGGVTLNGTLVASSIVTVNSLLQTFVIDIDLSYSYTRTEVNGYTSVVTGWWEFHFYATGSWTNIGGVIEVIGTYTVDEDGGNTASYDKTTPYSYSGPDGAQNGTLTDTASSSFSFSHGETGGNFSIDQTGVYGGADFVRTETSSHSLSHDDSSTYTASGPGASRSGSLDYWYISDYGLTQGENGSYDLSGFTSTYSVDSFVRDENGTYESSDSDSASYTVQFLDGEVEGNYSIRDSLSYSYSRHEEGDFQNGGATVNVTLFTHDENGTSNLSQSASASYTVSQTNYTDNASYTLVEVEGGGFTYHDEGNYTVDASGADVTGTSFSLSASATSSYEFDGSGSYSQSTALEDRQGPYSLSHSTSSSNGLTDSGSFAIDGSGLSVDGVTNQTSTLSATFLSSSSASYSTSLSAGNVTDQQSGWYSTSYVDSMDYTAGGAFSATGGYTLDQRSYAETTIDGDYSYTRSQSYGDVEHNENGTHSASFHDSGSYTVSGSNVDKTGTFTLTEIDDSTNEQTDTASYTKIATPTTTSGTLTATHSGSTSSSFVDSGTYTNASVSGSFTHDKILITEAHFDDDGIETTPSRTTDFTKNDDSTVSSSYHYTGNYTEWTASRTNNGNFTLDEQEDTTATYSGSYSYDEASSAGLIQIKTTDTVASTLSESGTYNRGTEGESRSASFSLHQLSNGTNSTSDSGTYTDTTGGTYRGLSESDTSITLDEDGSYSFSPSSAESRSYSFSQTTTTETTNDTGETRPFTNTTAYGTKTETVTASKTTTQSETGTYTRTSTINTRSASLTLTEDGEATTSISQQGTYTNGDIGTYTDTTKTVVNSSLSENGTLTNNAGLESRSATFTETKDTTTDVSYTTNYIFIEIDGGGIAFGSYDQNNNSHKDASQSDNGSYTRTASGESRTATRVLTEDTDFDSTFTREGTAIHSEGTDDFKTTQDGNGNESYSESGSYTKTPTVDTAGGTFSRDKWNMEDATKDVTTTYTLDLGDSATKSGTRKKKEETFRIFTGDESGTFTLSGGSVTRNGSFNDFETSETDATITDSGSMTAPATSGSASFSESQTSTHNVDIQQTGTFNETPTGNSRSYSFDYDRSASASSSYSQSGTGAGTASSSSSGYYGGYGGDYLGYHWIWSNYVGYGGGGTGTTHLKRTENGENSSSYHEDGNATSSGGETISSSASYTETDSSKSRRSISSSTSSSYSNSNSYSDHSQVSSGSGVDQGTESFSETYSYSATGTVTISRGSGGGSGGGSSSGGLGEMTRSLSGSFSHSEWDETRESYSGSFSGSTSASATDGATFSGQGSHSDTETNFDSSSYRETGSFTQTIVGEGGGSPSGSGGDFDTMNSSHTKITSASHSFSGSGGGTASGVGVGSGSGSGSGSSWGPPTFNHNWNGTQTNSLSHSYSTTGTIDEDRIAGTTNNSGDYSEQSFSAYSSSHHDDGSESAYGTNHNWNDNSSSSLTTTYTDNGSYSADGSSAGTEMNDDYGGSGWSTYDNYNGTPTSTSDYTPNTSDPQITTYPAEPPSSGDSESDEEGSSWLDWVQTGLDVIGFVDPFGIADGVNAVIHLARGNYVDAAISAAGMIPYVGDAAKAAKYAAKGVKAGVKLATAGAKMGAKAAGKAASAVADVARKGAKLADNAVRGAAATAKKALNKAGDLANSVACNLGLKKACFVGDTHVLIIDDEGLLADISIASGAEDEATMPPWAASVFWLGLGVGGYLVLNRKKRRAEAGLSPEDVDRWLAARTDDLPVWLEPDEALQESLAVEESSWGRACTAATGELVVAGSAWSSDEIWDEASIANFSDVATVCQKRPSGSSATISCGSTPDSWNRPLTDSLVEDGRQSLFDWRNERPRPMEPPIDPQWPDTTESADLEVTGNLSEGDAADSPELNGVRPMNSKSIGAPRPASFVRRCLAGAWLVVCLGAAALLMGWPNYGPSQSANSHAVVQPVAASRPSAPAYRSIPIRDVQVGQRVPAHNPEMTEDDRELAPVFEQLAWKKLTLESVKDDGSLLKMELLRPDEWVRDEQVQAGQSIELDLVEFGADGPATVLGIEDAPPVKPGSGSVVTGKFVHESAQVLDLTIEELDSPIGTTATHPFWSQDRKAFIPAMELVAGERLGTLDGATLRLTSVTPRAGPETVYNLEVNVEHVFYVSTRGLLVHNYCQWTDQGIYVLYEIQNGIKKVVYVGRGDVAARLAKHAKDPDKAKYLQETIIAGGLRKANAKGIEQGLIEKFGGAVSMNNGKINQLVNKIRSYVSGNKNFAAYEAAKNTKTQAALNLLKQKGFDVPP